MKRFIPYFCFILFFGITHPVEAVHSTKRVNTMAFSPPTHLSGFQKWVLKRITKRIQRKLAKAKNQEKRRKPEILSVLGFSSSLFGLLILLGSGGIGLFFLGLGLFLSLIGLIRYSAHPKQHAGVSLLFGILGLLISGGVAIALLSVFA
ncbi:MAG: hypothetical protein KTR30_32895 [Saprospiraceae bacterium]|nr:hypothetical protein [Saprospiraceae bacterium]